MDVYILFDSIQNKLRLKSHLNYLNIFEYGLVYFIHFRWLKYFILKPNNISSVNL